MIYLLYGKDDFSLQESLSSIKEGVEPAELRDVNITVFDGAQVSFDLLAATCATVPFLSAKRLVVVKGLLSLFERRAPSLARSTGARPQPPALGQWEELSQFLPSVPETTDLAFVEGHLSVTNPLLSAIRQQVIVRTFPLLKPGEIRQWIRRRTVSAGIDIEPKAVDALVETIGGDLRIMSEELKKLVLYRWGNSIRQEDVQKMVSYVKEANVFEAVDAVMEDRPEVAIRLMHQLLDSGRPPSYLLSMIARQVRLLLLAKDLKARGVPPAQQGRRLGLTGYPLRKIIEQEARFSAQRLVEIHRMLLEADLSIKTGSVPEDLILDTLIAETSLTLEGHSKRPTVRHKR